MRESLRASFRRWMSLEVLPKGWELTAIGAAIGTLTGLASVGFAEALHVFERFVHERQTALPMWLLFVGPVMGMGLTGVLVHTFASEARGHGVPQVMAALIKRGGRIPLRVGVVKVIASILTVGSGGSAGTEGPIVQIGATIGSVTGGRLRVNPEALSTLVGCGAAAGISSIFNAPIAGVFFVLEILLRDFSLRTFTPIVVASVFSAVATQAALGSNEAIFPVVEGLREAQFHFRELPSYIILGLVCGLVAVGFNRLLHYGEDVYDRSSLHPLLKPITGALLLSALGIVYLMIARQDGATGAAAHIPAFFGNGYPTIGGLLEPGSYALNASTAAGLSVDLWLILLLVVMKGVATTLTLASGGSGGVFAPSLFLGATAGAVVGMTLDRLNLLPVGSTPASYALVGMAAVVAAATHGPLTAILILFEMTRNVYVMLPIMLAAVVATLVSQLIDRDSIYTAKLRRQGVRVGGARDHTLLRRIPVSSIEVVPLPPEPVYPSDPLAKLVSLHAHYRVPDFVVVDQEGQYVGMVTGGDMRQALIDREAIPLLLVAELLRHDLPTVGSGEMLDSAMDKFAEHDIAALALVDGEGRPEGLITRARLLQRYREALREA